MDRRHYTWPERFLVFVASVVFPPLGLAVWLYLRGQR
jgi:hypothetical protein